MTKIREDVYLCDKLFKYMCLFFPPMRNQRRISGLMKKSIFFISILLCISQTFALQGAKYLIIAPDNFVQALKPLADWKTKKGVKAMVVPLSVTGNSATQIKSYIVNAYNNWEIRPEYILLAGFGIVLPASGTSDDFYADITGDYQIELSIGRLPCTTIDQCNMLVAKILGYERTPYISDTLWFRKGTTIIREDNPPDAYYQSDCRYIRNLMLSHGFVQTDSFLSTQGHNSTNVMNAINDGRSYVVFRGQSTVNWWSPFDQVNPSNLTNGFKLPVVICGSCVTMSLNTTGYQADRFLLAGTATNPKGTIAYFGTTSSGSHISLPRGIVAKGFFQALFEENKFVLGDITKRSKYLLDSLYPDQTRYKEWNLLGDPELNLWTSTPKPIAVHNDTIINNLQQIYNVSVTYNDFPLTGALVCLMKDTTVYQYAYTDSSGIISFNIYPHTTGTMSVTVTAHNFIPYEKNVSVVPANLTHNVGVLSIIEPVGTIASGINIIPKVKVQNFGIYTDTFPVTFRIDTIYNNTRPGVILNPGDTATISFQTWTSIIGNYPVTAFCALSNDQWRGNDTVYYSINVIYTDDVGVDSILSPGNLCYVNHIVVPQAKIRNFGISAQMNFSVICSIINSNGILRYTDTKIISLSSLSDTLINFSSWTPTIAELCTAKIRTNLLNDMNPANDSKIKTTTISNLAQVLIGTATTYTANCPINRYRSYSTCEMIYLQSEINTMGRIANIAYYKDRGTNIMPFENVRIYMKHTTDTTLTDGTYSLIGYTEVFNGTYPNNADSGWMEVPLSTPFEYNNEDNIQILVLKGYQQYLNNGYPYWRYSTTSPRYRCRENHGDGSQPTNLYTTTTRPNIMLTMSVQPLVTNDIGVVSIISPTNYHQPYTMMTPKAKIKNYGLLPQVNFPVICSITNTSGILRYIDTFNVPNLACSETLRVSFRPWTPTITEICTVHVRTALIQDSNQQNDKKIRITNINNTVQVIIGTATTNSYAGPMNRYYNYSAHEALYLQSEISSIGFITSIAYYKDHGTDLSPIANVIIYMKHTTDTVLTSGNYSLNGYTEVFNSSFTNNNLSGWMSVALTTPFYYNNNDNLQILILKGYQAYVSTCPYWCYTATNPLYRCRQSYGDASIPVTITQTYNRPNIRLTIHQFYNDIGVKSIVYPLNVHRINNIIIPTVVIKNYGVLGQNNVPVICSICGINNTLRYFDTLSIESLVPNETTSVCFSEWQPTISETCITKIQINTNDDNPGNNRKTKTTVISQIYLLENFTDTIFPPPNWTIYNFDHGNYTWVRNANNPYSPPACATCRLDTGSLVNNDWIITPRIGPVRENDSLIFYYRAHSPNHHETLLVNVSTSENISDTLSYAIRNLFSTDSVIYMRQTLNLSDYTDSMIYIAFQYKCRELQIYLDDIIVRGYDPEGISTDKTYNLPFITMLYPSRPNPIRNSISQISFSLAEPSKVKLIIYDISGRIIKTLVNNQIDIGLYHYTWNCKDENSKTVAQGIYFYTLETAKQKFTKKMIVLN